MPIDDRFEQLLTAARAGVEPAWRELYDELSPAVLGYLRARGAGEPEDLTGEVFLQVVRDLNRFDGDWRGFRAWVMTIAHHRLLDEGRSRSRRPVEPVAEPPEPAGAVVVGVEDAAELRLGLERATAMLSDLSADQRAVLLLRVVADLTIDEVARVVGKRPGAVKQLQRRALLAVRKRLEREGTLP
ncbi:MAG TPA: sigma-70 family RNA polymerase sigma factor [Solirubrobacterales bacterium]|nr:sigma-70 family RNA polymerase sigma factor [Solirubrobacterales bacterium]